MLRRRSRFARRFAAEEPTRRITPGTRFQPDVLFSKRPDEDYEPGIDYEVEVEVKVKPMQSERWHANPVRSKMYVWVKNLCFSNTKDFTRFVRQFFPDIEDLSGVDLRGASYGRNTGCSCGCSPGFRLKNDYDQEVFVDLIVR